MSKNNVHQGLQEIIQGILKTQNIPFKVSLSYPQHTSAIGEMDILCNDIYYEVKSNLTPKNFKKAINQIHRAMKYGQCNYGYIITKTGVYDPFSKEQIK